MLNQTVDLICRQFDLGSVLSVHQTQGTRTRSCVLETDTGTWFLRNRFKGYSDPDRIAFDHAAAFHLDRSGIPVPTPRTTSEGESFINVSGETWEVFPFLEGEPMREADSAQLESLGREMGRFHRAGESFKKRFDKLGPRGETEPRVLLDLCERLDIENPECTHVVSRYRGWIKRATANLTDERFENLPHTLIHGDVQPGNLLFRENQLSAWLDLDWCAWRPRLYDLCFALLFCCGTHRTPIQGEDIYSLTQPFFLDENLVGSFLEGHHSVGIRLNKAERRALHPQLVLSWCHSRLAGAFKVSKKERLPFLAREPFDLDTTLEPVSRVL